MERENYGPLTIPKKGVTVTITKDNIALANRLLTDMKEKMEKLDNFLSIKAEIEEKGSQATPLNRIIIG